MEVVGGVPGDAEVTALLVHRPVPILKSDGDRDLGLLDVVGTRCGPDLVDARKLTPDFFERVFRLAGALPTEAAVVDDNTEPLPIAARLGARTMHVTSACDGPCEATLHIDSILELPAALLHLV